MRLRFQVPVGLVGRIVIAALLAACQNDDGCAGSTPASAAMVGVESSSRLSATAINTAPESRPDGLPSQPAPVQPHAMSKRDQYLVLSMSPASRPVLHLADFPRERARRIGPDGLVLASPLPATR